MFTKSLSNFIRGSEFKSAVGHSHTIFKARKKPKAGKPASPSYGVEWFCKLSSTISTARSEVVAQELFRLLSVHVDYPKTRLAFDNENKPYVLSKEVPGFTPLSQADTDRYKDLVINRTYQGLGDIVVLSLLLNEIDLKFSNLGVTPKGQLIKVDGDWCFASLGRVRPYSITSEMIDALPGPHTYRAHNWLHCLSTGISDAEFQKNDTITKKKNEIENEFKKKPYVSEAQRTRDKEEAIAAMIAAAEVDAIKHKEEIKATTEILKNLPHVREAINGAILRAITLPEDFIRSFTQGYIVGEEKSEEAIAASSCREEFLIGIITEWYKAALENKSFMTYLASDAADAHIEMTIEHFKKFESAKKHKPFTSDFEKATRANFVALKRKCKPSAAAAPAAPPDAGATGPTARRPSR